MIKWIGLRLKDDEKMMLNMECLDKIYCENSHIGENDDFLYLLVFTFVNHDEEIKIVYGCKVRRDYIYHEIWTFINQKDIFFYEIPKND